MQQLDGLSIRANNILYNIIYILRLKLRENCKIKQQPYDKNNELN